VLHCIEQTEGEDGANLWVDGFHAANLLFEEDPESFQILVNTPVVFRNITQTKRGKFYAASRRPIIRLVVLLLVMIMVYVLLVDTPTIAI
jgi:hypothetical protein